MLQFLLPNQFTRVQCWCIRWRNRKFSSNVCFEVAHDENIKDQLEIRKETLPVKNTRNIGKSSMILNTSTPHIEVDPETYEVRADGELLTCEPAEVLSLAQKYFMF